VTGVAVARVADPPAPRRRRRRLWAALLLVLLVAAGGFVLARRLGGDPGGGESVLVGHPAPALVGSSLDGARFDLAGWRGHVVLVNVWGSWCTPCRQEQPLLAAAYSSLHARGLRMVGIDVKDRASDAHAFLAAYGRAAWPSVADPDGEHAVDWGTFALPETYLVGRDGTVLAKSVGPVTAEWIDREVVPRLTAGTR
jgi:cytochrome c biogenesis protein CcmG/thiol:disulfide interchange protein DsbE